MAHFDSPSSGVCFVICICGFGHFTTAAFVLATNIMLGNFDNILEMPAGLTLSPLGVIRADAFQLLFWCSVVMFVSPNWTPSLSYDISPRNLKICLGHSTNRRLESQVDWLFAAHR